MVHFAFVVISWFGCVLIVGTAFQAFPVPVSIGDALTLHARFEAKLAQQESEP